MIIFDTSGREIFDRLRPVSYSGTDIALICYNIDEPKSLTNATEKWMPEIGFFCDRCSVVLVGCKIDLRHDPEMISKLKQRNEKPIKTKTGKKIASKIHIDAYIECSVKTQQGVQELFIEAIRLTSRGRHCAMR